SHNFKDSTCAPMHLIWMHQFHDKCRCSACRYSCGCLRGTEEGESRPMCRMPRRSGPDVGGFPGMARTNCLPIDTRHDILLHIEV
ncbi:hypothetical protein PFISCL1PPCAC_22665, partial [Pristionchus fissidentatus]